jgi:hypothetical protein
MKDLILKPSENMSLKGKGVFFFLFFLREYLLTCFTGIIMPGPFVIM